MSNRYKIAAVPTGKVERIDGDVAGCYFFEAETETEALDQFHRTVPIKVLDDFEIDVELEPITTEQDLDFICEAARDFADLMAADDSGDPDEEADVKKIRAALERLGR